MLYWVYFVGCRKGSGDIGFEIIFLLECYIFELGMVVYVLILEFWG